MAERKIKILYYKGDEMAVIKLDDKQIYCGNYHDFRAGSSGANVAGYDLSELWDKGILSLATALRYCIEKSGDVVDQEVIYSDECWDNL